MMMPLDGQPAGRPALVPTLKLGWSGDFEDTSLPPFELPAKAGFHSEGARTQSPDSSNGGSANLYSNEDGDELSSYESDSECDMDGFSECSGEFGALVGSRPPSPLRQHKARSGSPVQSTFDLANLPTMDALPPMQNARSGSPAQSSFDLANLPTMDALPPMMQDFRRGGELESSDDEDEDDDDDDEAEYYRTVLLRRAWEAEERQEEREAGNTNIEWALDGCPHNEQEGWGVRAMCQSLNQRYLDGDDLTESSLPSCCHSPRSTGTMTPDSEESTCASLTLTAENLGQLNEELCKLNDMVVTDITEEEPGTVAAAVAAPVPAGEEDAGTAQEAWLARRSQRKQRQLDGKKVTYGALIRAGTL